MSCSVKNKDESTNLKYCFLSPLLLKPMQCQDQQLTPMLTLKNSSSFFPTYYRYKHITNTRKPKAKYEIHITENPHPDQKGNSFTYEHIKLKYMNNRFRVFRSSHLFKNSKDYLSQLEKVEKKKSQIWKYMSIFLLYPIVKNTACLLLKHASYCHTPNFNLL